MTKNIVIQLNIECQPIPPTVQSVGLVECSGEWCFRFGVCRLGMNEPPTAETVSKIEDTTGLSGGDLMLVATM
jgi:hypothetical protein